MSDRLRLLDCFCGAGGAAVGYSRAGFDIIGVDNRPQPSYPFPFICDDALDVLRQLAAGWSVGPAMPDGRRYRRHDFAAIHASPPCQAYSRTTAWRGKRSDHPDLIDRVRVLISAVGVPHVIENVQEARRALRFPIMLCGSMFGLRVQRHRYFESPSLPLVLVSDCQHRSDDYSFDHGGKQTERVYADAMGCDWMTVHEARQAIPPAFTEFIGRQLVSVLEEVPS